MQSQGASVEEIDQVTRALAQGQGFEGVQPANEFVKAWGEFMAGELSGLGLAAILGRSGSWFAKGTSDWTKLSGQLTEATKGKGNFGIGSGTREQADVMGKARVGDGYQVASDGKTLVSLDGLRQYRPPTYKPFQQETQANFERRFPGQETKRWQSNAHLDITD